LVLFSKKNSLPSKHPRAFSKAEMSLFFAKKTQKTLRVTLHTGFVRDAVTSQALAHARNTSSQQRCSRHQNFPDPRRQTHEPSAGVARYSVAVSA
jgi:hypothetical protein